MLPAALSTGHKIGLLVMALILIGFALFSALIAPRRWPTYPGRGLTVFIVASMALFALMIGAVEGFGGESEAATASELVSAPPAGGAIQVAESEWKIVVPTTTLTSGTHTFEAVNAGTVQHDLTIDGPGVHRAHTRKLAPGESADLTVRLVPGTYDLYCSVPGHRQYGMNTQITVR